MDREPDVYQYKDDLIHAVQLKLSNRNQVIAWMQKELFCPSVKITGLGLLIEESSDSFTVYWGDWIVKEDGSFRKVKDYTFKKLFKKLK